MEKHNIMAEKYNIVHDNFKICLKDGGGAVSNTPHDAKREIK